MTESVLGAANDSETELHEGDCSTEVRRTALLEKVLGQMRNRHITVVAPTGFGKSHFLRQLYRKFKLIGVSAIWMDIHAGLHDAEEFALALRGGLLETTDEIVAARSSLGALVNMMAARENPLSIFIDQFHAAAPETRLVVKRLIDAELSHVQFVLADRKWPGVGLDGFRLRGGVLELGVDDLCFTHNEIKKTLPDLSHADAETILRKTSGWPAGVRLAWLFLEDGGASVDMFSGYSPIVEQYIDGLLTDCDPQHIKMLAQTTLFGVHEAPMSRAEMLDPAIKHAAMCIHETSGYPFSFARNREVIRHNPLFFEYFRSLAERVIDDKEMQKTHRRLAGEAEAGGDIAKAVYHGVAARDDAFLRVVFYKHASSLFDAFGVDARSLSLIMNDPAVFDLLPRLRKTALWACRQLQNGDLEAAAEALNDLAKRDATDCTASDKRYVAPLNALIRLYSDRNAIDAIQYMHRNGMDPDSAPNKTVFGLSSLADAIFTYRNGDIAAAIDSIGVALRDLADAEMQAFRIDAMQYYAYIKIEQADYEMAESLCDACAQLIRRCLPEGALQEDVQHLLQALILYERGGLSAALSRLDGVKQRLLAAANCLSEYKRKLVLLEARIMYGLAGYKAAQSRIACGVSAAREENRPGCEQVLLAERLRLAVVHNDYDLASRCYEDFGKAPRNDVEVSWEADTAIELARLRYQIAYHSDETAIEDFLARLRARVRDLDLRRVHNRLDVYNVLLLYRSGQEKEAAGALVSLLEKRKFNADYLTAFLEEGRAGYSVLDETGRRFARGQSYERLHEPLLLLLLRYWSFCPLRPFKTIIKLSDQEKAILALAALGCSRNEMSERLSTTIHNVQYHVKKLLNVFDVNGIVGLSAKALASGAVTEHDLTQYAGCNDNVLRLTKAVSLASRN